MVDRAERRKLSERLGQQPESARLHHRGAVVHPLVRFVATILLSELGLMAKPRLAMEGPKYTKQTKTAEELEAMILEDLRNVEGCAQSGITVTVYGIPWKSMLMFGAAAGPVRNKAELQRLCDIITERLQRLYDVV